MPRIDPLQLLKCLSVLLTPEGGILSRDEVPRLVSLMTKFSKKLVSKCVYVLILSNTETSLLELFMAEGGWTLIQTWLEDAMKTCNDDLVVEILNLLLITPVDIERLKSNTIPRLVKTLTKREGNGSVKELSTLLVQKWLAIVKSTTQEMAAQKAQSVEQTEQQSEPVEVAEEVTVNEHQVPDEHEAVEETNEASDDNKDAISTGSFYKLTVRGGKQVISRLSSSENEAEPAEEETGEHAANKTPAETEDKNKELEKKKSKSDKDKSKSKSSSSSSKSSSSKSSSHKEKEKDKHKSSSSSKSSSRDKEKSSSNRDKEKDRERDKERKDRDKDKHRHNGMLKHSSSSKDKERRESKDKDRKDRKDKDKESKDKHSDKDPKEKQAEKDKDTLAKIKPHTLDKIGRIPKKSSSEKPKEGEKDKLKDGEKTKEIDRPKENDKPKENKEQKKKGSISIEVRKNTEERPKTVKIFNSKMRSTGLEEEVKPPPPRNAVKKVQPTTVLPSIPQKRPSPPRDGPLIPEKKVRLDIVDRPVPERPGAIKLIPPKPKPMILQESDIFMDALNASATAKKEPKKRKRRPSVSKDPTSTSPTPSASSPTKEESSGATSPPSFKNIAPPNFYQDTLETGGNDVEMKDVKDEEESPESPDIKLSDLRDELRAEDAKEEKLVADDTLNTSASTTESGIEAKKPKTEGLKGVLVYIKKKGPKRSVRWKADEDLVEIRHFELDETERVNVTKTFMDMAKMEMTSEREALQLSRKLAVEDTMEAQISWRFPYLVDQPELKVQPGCNSLEKDIQFAREKNVLQALYFHKRMIPDSPAEPLPETHPMSDPVVIPLEDPECQEIDLRNTPWPEPKSTPPVEPPVSIAPMFRNVQQPQPQPFQNFQPMNAGGFQGMPRFQGPVGHGGPGQMPDAHQMMEAPAFLGPQSAYGHPNMMNHNIMGHPNMGHPEMMGQGPIDPGMFGLGGPGPMGPPGGPMQGPDGFDHMMNDGSGFQGGYEQPNMGMFHHQNNSNNNYEMNRPPCNDREDGGGRGRGRGRGYHHRRGGGGGGGSGGGGGGWVRLNNGPSHHGSGSWRGGGGPNRTNTNRVCKNVKNHGYCRNVDTCPFIHPN